MVDFFSVELRQDGHRVEVLRTARRNDLVELLPSEEARLDALGMLCPLDQDEASLEQELDEHYASYAAARRGIVPATPETW